MLGWIIVMVTFSLAISFAVRSIKDGESLLGVVVGGILLGLFSIYPSVDYYAYRIEPIAKLEAYKRTIEQTKALIKDRDINLQDMEITKTLSEVIKERNEYIARLKMAKRNPFCLFKPKLKLD